MPGCRRRRAGVMAAGRRSARCTPCSTRQAVADWALLAAGGAAQATRITPLLERCWTFDLPGCRAAPHRQGDVRHDDVTAALGIPPKDNGHELALIRGGYAPGQLHRDAAVRARLIAGKVAKPPQFSPRPGLFRLPQRSGGRSAVTPRIA